MADTLLTYYKCSTCGVNCIRMPHDPSYARKGFCSAECEENKDVPGFGDEAVQRRLDDDAKWMEKYGLPV